MSRPVNVAEAVPEEVPVQRTADDVSAAAAGGTAERGRPPADRAMRSLLRIEGPPIPGAVFSAQGFMSRSIVVSAIRCTITYLLVPILTPIVGVLNLVDVPLSMVLIALAIVMSTRSLRRFWLADHAQRWSYTALIAVVWVLLTTAFVTDIARLV